MFIAQIYKFTVGAIINRPKKVCAIYAGEQCSPLQEKPLIERFLLAVRGRPSKPEICAIYHNLSGCFKKA